jgi:phospholipid transport system substrate-binding protein
MLKRLKTTLLKGILLAGLASPVLAAEPVELVRDTTHQVLETLRKDNGSNTRAVRAQVEELVIPKFDFKRMTALAVGLGWRQADAAQQAELAKQFQSLLVRSYASTMNRFKNAKVEVSPNAVLANDGREATVKSQVTLNTTASSGNNQPVSVDYTFYKTGQGWKVYNVTVEGASLITAYRNSFGEEIRKGGVDGLIKALKAKNAGYTANAKGAGA